MHTIEGVFAGRQSVNRQLLNPCGVTTGQVTSPKASARVLDNFNLAC